MDAITLVLLPLVTGLASLTLFTAFYWLKRHHARLDRMDLYLREAMHSGDARIDRIDHLAASTDHLAVSTRRLSEEVHKTVRHMRVVAKSVREIKSDLEEIKDNLETVGYRLEQLAWMWERDRTRADSLESQSSSG